MDNETSRTSADLHESELCALSPYIIFDQPPAGGIAVNRVIITITGNYTILE